MHLTAAAHAHQVPVLHDEEDSAAEQAGQANKRTGEDHFLVIMYSVPELHDEEYGAPEQAGQATLT